MICWVPASFLCFCNFFCRTIQLSVGGLSSVVPFSSGRSGLDSEHSTPHGTILQSPRCVGSRVGMRCVERVKSWPVSSCLIDLVHMLYNYAVGIWGLVTPWILIGVVVSLFLPRNNRFLPCSQGFLISIGNLGSCPLLYLGCVGRMSSERAIMTGPLNTPIGSTSAFSCLKTFVTFVRKFQVAGAGEEICFAAGFQIV